MKNYNISQRINFIILLLLLDLRDLRLNKLLCDFIVYCKLQSVVVVVQRR